MVHLCGRVSVSAELSEFSGINTEDEEEEEEEEEIISMLNIRMCRRATKRKKS
jgi:hypothetical protein